MANMTIGGINLIVTNNVKMDAYFTSEVFKIEVILEIKQILNNNFTIISLMDLATIIADTVTIRGIKTECF